MTTDQTSIARFLTRKLPPCTVKGCGGQPRAEFVNLAPEAVGDPGQNPALRAVYVCDDCGGMWDHNGQPLARLEAES